jgi:hypothetical protein
MPQAGITAALSAAVDHPLAPTMETTEIFLSRAKIKLLSQ